MESRREFWWLVALEATLFLSASCWETVAAKAAPLSHPFRFSSSLVVTATAATLSCHLGPAVFARRFGGKAFYLKWVLLIWLGAGYIEWLGSLARSIDWQDSQHNWVQLVFLTLVVITIWLAPAWKPLLVLVLVLAAAILVSALDTTWHGIGLRNRYFSGPSEHLDWPFIRGLMLSAAPSVVIGWRIGRIEPRSSKVWLSGLAGVWLPMVLSVTMAAVAIEAGVNLHYHPTLPRSMSWALLGRSGQLQTSVIVLWTSTLLGPALLSAFALRELTPKWGRTHKAWPIPILIGLASYGASFMKLPSSEEQAVGVYFTFLTPVHEFWAWSLAVLGTCAGLAGMLATMQSSREP